MKSQQENDWNTLSKVSSIDACLKFIRSHVQKRLWSSSLGITRRKFRREFTWNSSSCGLANRSAGRNPLEEIHWKEPIGMSPLDATEETTGKHSGESIHWRNLWKVLCEVSHTEAAYWCHWSIVTGHKSIPAESCCNAFQLEVPTTNTVPHSWQTCAPSSRQKVERKMRNYLFYCAIVNNVKNVCARPYVIRRRTRCSHECKQTHVCATIDAAVTCWKAPAHSSEIIPWLLKN